MASNRSLSLSAVWNRLDEADNFKSSDSVTDNESKILPNPKSERVKGCRSKISSKGNEINFSRRDSIQGVQNKNLKRTKSSQNVNKSYQQGKPQQNSNKLKYDNSSNKIKQMPRNGKKNLECRDGSFSKQELGGMDFLRVKKLFERSPNEILLTIMDKESGFIHLLKQNVGRNLMAYILLVLGKALTSDMTHNLAGMINTVSSKSSFFLMNIQKYLASFQLHKSEQYHLDSLVSLTVFLQKFQVCLPANASDVLLILLPLLTQTCEKHLLNSGKLYSVAVENLKELEDQNNFFFEKYSNKGKEMELISRNERLQLLDPPEDYRSIPVLPNINDVQQPCSFLRPNLTKGRYSNTEHYLDVQYRLLREDYVKPLRDGIAEYLRLKKQNKPFSKCRDVKVYTNVQIVKQEFVNGGLVHMAYFSDKNLTKIKWEYSKRFLTGALLCFSPDDFQTMLFATVARRDPKELSKGLLIIRFEEMTDDVLNLNPLINFVVLETSAYFEAYRHNLGALLQLNEDTLPLKNYIIETQTDVSKPLYLDKSTTYDMQPLLLPLGSEVQTTGSNFHRSSRVAEKLKNITVLDESSWPTPSELNLDPSQFAALKAAVTKEFAVIQGPPGTGKTYVGLRIAQLLLHNASRWQSETNPCPILVICYTNHALDQFLEGMLLFTQKIVRVGGRGKNEALSHFQLNNLKREIKAKRQVPHYIFSSIKQKNYELYCLKEEIDRVRKRVDISYATVMGEDELFNFIASSHYTSLNKFGRLYNLKDDGHLIQDWLGTRVSSMDCELVKRRQTLLPNLIPKYDPNIISVTAESLAAVQNDEDSEAEVDIEYIEAQRDINSDEFADVSYEMPQYHDDDIELLPIFEDGWQVQGGRKSIKKYIRHYLTNSEAMSEKEAKRVTNVWALPIEQRWRLYKFWLKSFIEIKEKEALELQQQLRREYNQLCEMRTEEDIHVCKQALVVGMTTTGAAKYRHIVQHLNPKIIIVEEAAEILESHIVTSLTRDTQHVILIGDHQQLRPNPTVHLLATKFNLNVSLFERMVENGLDCYRLDIQHRMRPEIASLLVPHIYTNLQNHENVKTFENIKGVSKNVFFITHSYNELQEYDSKSKVNVHEAKFMVKLCRYLILQGYRPSQITVLTTYSGQLFELKRQSNKSFLQEVKFTVVDNYQGEENDIILISFVRSNEEGEIGFLKVSNRVCVALSRAKKGLFCIGNFQLLAEKSDLWKNIVDKLKEDNAIGPSLQLTCQNHPGVSNVVESETDFDSVPEGGCTRKCEFRLPCGHVCSLMCHPYDAKHEEVRCPKPCTKKCANGHLCMKKCYKDCNPCLVSVSKKMKACGHIIEVPCYLEKDETNCTNLCDEYLPCGHMCTNRCSDPCVITCMERIRIKSSVCSHKIIIECSNFEKTEMLIRRCKEPCRTELSCGHMCRGSCGRCRQGRLHVACKQPCKRILVCGHECTAPCSESCPPCKEPCENKCSHSKCPKTCGEPCEKCTEPCSWSCEHKKCNQTCGELCDRTACDEPCTKGLKCEHECIGVCGEPCPSECRECDKEKVKEIFFGSEDEDDARFVCLEDCKHIFELNGITQWMSYDTSRKAEIQMKACPKCKTVIRKSLRFGNIIKLCLEDIEKVKKITYGDSKHNIKLQKVLIEKINASGKLSQLQKICQPLLKVLDSGKNTNIRELSVIENVINILLLLTDITANINGIHVTENSADNGIHNSASKLKLYIKNTKRWLILFIQNEFSTASQQQLKELSWEVHRLKLAVKLLTLINENLSAESKIQLDNLILLIVTYAPFHDAEMKNFMSELQNFAKHINSAVIKVSELEKQSILKAMGLTKGHWYQCPNGHVYCITECGGATQASTCNECGEKIGGSNHSLLPTNQVATDMDGATHSAWSDAMNMNNYRF